MNTTADLAVLTVNEVISQYPATIEVFNRYAIDACCGGAASIIDAAIRHGADVDALLAELQQVVARST